MTAVRRLAVTIATALLASCGSYVKGPPPADSAACATTSGRCPQGNEYALVRVWYATDRAKVEGSPTPIEFGASRSPVNYGHIEVSIPASHRTGDLEAPSALRFEFAADPAKHVVLRSVTQLPASQYFAELGARVEASKTRDALIFLHGYNVTFEDAARRTAQITYDLKFRAPRSSTAGRQWARPAPTHSMSKASNGRRRTFSTSSLMC